MRFLPVDRIAMNVSLAGSGRIKPEAKEPILPDGGDRVLGAGDEPGVRGADRLPAERLAHPYLAGLAVVQADGRVFAVIRTGAQLRADAGPGIGLIRFLAFT